MSSSKTTTRGRVRHVDVWSVFKISLLFFFVCGIVWLVAVIILWNAIAAFGYVSQVESLAGKLAGGSFKLDAGSLLRAAVLVDVVLVLGSALGATLLAVLYNLISDVVGGITVRVEDVPVRADGGLLSRLNLPFRRKAPAVDGLGTATQRSGPQPVPARTAPATSPAVAGASGKSAPAKQPNRPPGGGGVSVKRTPAATRSPAQARGVNSTSRSPDAGDTEVMPTSGGSKVRDTASVAPVPPKKAPEP